MQVQEEKGFKTLFRKTPLNDFIFHSNCLRLKNESVNEQGYLRYGLVTYYEKIIHIRCFSFMNLP